jgi:hypothetical protein
MSERHTTSGNSRAAARRLNELLSARSAYRQRWERYAIQQAGNGVHQAAVTRVLATHLQTAKQSSGERTRARHLKDLVSRALSGQVLSARTAALFIAAFEMSPADADELWALLGGHPAEPMTPGPATGRSRTGTRTGTGTAPSRTGFHTVAFTAVQTLGPDGLPRVTKTLHVLRAKGALAGYRCLLDHGVHRVDMIRGGTTGRPYPVHQQAAVNLTFHRPLQAGETGTLEYAYRYRPGVVVPPRLRCGGRERMENVTVQIRFHPLRLPDRVWWAIWPEQTPVPAAQEEMREEPVELDPDGTAHGFVESVEHRLIGFRWRFPA